MSARDEDSIVLIGPPRNVSGVVPIGVRKSSVVPISVSTRNDSTVYRAVLRPIAGNQGEIRLRLPAETAPGTYQGEATIDGKPRRVRIEVEQVMRISVQPRQAKLTAAATSSVAFAVTLVNSGNVPFDVPQTDVFDLDDSVAQERALGRTLRAELSQGEHRMDRYFDELRDGHGGEARVAVRAGAGPLVPGESRELACSLNVPATAKEGRSYTGPWHLGNTALVIVADIKKGARPVNKKAKR